MLSLLFVLVFLALPMVSAYDWDNIKHYDKENKIIWVENALGLGEEIVRMQLLTPLDNFVADEGDGVYQLVAEIKVHNFNEGHGSFDSTKTYDAIRGMAEVDRDIILKYRIKTNSKEDIFDYVCKEYGFENGTSYCSKYKKEKTGEKNVEKYEWVEFNDLSELPKSNVVIGLFADVKPNEKVEWIPDKWFGVRIDEWAAWTTGLDNGLESYYQLEEYSGAVIDSVGHWNGTYDGERRVDGIFDKGYRFNGTNDNVSFVTNNALNLTENMSFFAWINTSDLGLRPQAIVQKGDLSVSYAFVVFNNGSLFYFHDSNRPYIWSNVSITTNNTWHHVGFVRDETAKDIKLYLDGFLVGYTAYSTTPISQNFPARFGSYNFGSSNFGGVMDEIGIWNRTLSQAEITYLYDNGIGTFKNNYPIVTLNAPENNTNFLYSNNINFNCSSNAYGGGNIVNLSLYVDGLLKNTVYNTTVNQDYLVLENTIAASTFGLGTHDWNCSSYNVQGNLSSTIDNYYFNVANKRVDNESYNSVAYETDRETYSINLTYDNITFTDINAVLRYNGTSYTPTKSISGDKAYFNSSFILPLTMGQSQENRSFYWNITLTNSTSIVYEQSTTYNQTVEPIILERCDGSGEPYINFTFRDEVLLTDVNATFQTDWSYYLEDGDGSVVRDLDYTNASENSNYTFCFSPSDRDLHLIGNNTQYSSSDYITRGYFFNSILTNITTNRILYLLSSADGIFAQFQVAEVSNGEPISNVKATAQRIINATLTTVDQRFTDQAGFFLMWLNPDFQHTMTFEKTGCTTLVRTINPTSSDVYTVLMDCGLLAGGENITSWNETAIINDLIYTIEPISSFLNNNTVYNFKITVESTNSVDVTMNLTLANGTVLHTESGSGTNIILSENINTDGYTSIVGRFTFSNVNETYVITKIWSIDNYYTGDFSLNSFMTYFGDIDNIAIWKWIRALIMIATLLGVGFLLYTQSGTDALDSAFPAIIGITLLIWIFSFAGWLTIGTSTTRLTDPQGILNYQSIINQYVIALLTTIIGGGLIVWKTSST